MKQMKYIFYSYLMSYPFYFTLQLNYGVEKPDYIISFDNDYWGKYFDEEMYIYRQIEHESITNIKIIDNKSFIDIFSKDEILRSKRNEIENKVINEIVKMFDSNPNYKIDKINNEYHIIYPKYNDIKFLRILNEIFSFGSS